MTGTRQSRLKLGHRQLDLSIEIGRSGLLPRYRASSLTLLPFRKFQFPFLSFHTSYVSSFREHTTLVYIQHIPSASSSQRPFNSSSRIHNDARHITIHHGIPTYRKQRHRCDWHHRTQHDPATPWLTHPQVHASPTASGPRQEPCQPGHDQ